MNWMCHPSSFDLRAHLHNKLPPWKLFPDFCSSVSSYFYFSGAGLFSFCSVQILVNIRTGDFFFSPLCKFCANLPVVSTLSILHLFYLILPLVPYVPAIHLLMLVALQFQCYTFALQASQNYFGMHRLKNGIQLVAKICLRSRWLLWQVCVL